jgi:CRISPR-associated protein Cmr5
MALTQEQRRANFAFQKVSLVGSKDESFQAKYGGYSHRLPILIRSSGLMASLEFLATRKDEGAKAVLRDLSEYATTEMRVKLDTGADLRSHVRGADLRQYVRLSREFSATLLWFKRFAVSVLKVEMNDMAEVNS